MNTFSIVGAVQKSTTVLAADIHQLAPAVECKESNDFEIEVVKGGASYNVAMGSVNPATFVVVDSSLVLNITLTTLAGSAVYAAKFLVIVNSAITAITLSNSSATTNATARIILGGD